MGWDAGLNRKLAVPLALGKLWEDHDNRMGHSRRLKEIDGDPEDLRMLMVLADNRMRLEKLSEELDNSPEMADDEELRDELDYINASVQLGLLEITGELEEIQGSDEVFAEAMA
jgi:hypothetical protein